MLMVKKFINLNKAKDSEIVATSLCLAKVSKDWSVDNMKKTGSNGCVYDSNVNYDAITVAYILDIRHLQVFNKKNKVV